MLRRVQKWGLVGLVVLVALVGVATGLSGSEPWKSVGPLVLAALGIALTATVAWQETLQLTKQDDQLRQIKEIGLRTHEISERLSSEAYTTAFVQAFFCQAGSRRYTCFFPAGLESGKPMYSMTMGDFWAFKNLSALLGEALTPSPVDRSLTRLVQPRRDAVFLCSPWANRELEALAKPWRVLDDAHVQTSLFEDRLLPCWFAEDGRQDRREQGDTRAGIVQKIAILQRGAPNGGIEELKGSPSEGDYISAYACKKAVDSGQLAAVVPTCYDPMAQPHKGDLALILRIKLEARIVFVFAGIHQYGTWIAGEYLNRLAHGLERGGLAERMRESTDFVALVGGLFDQGKWAIKRAELRRLWLWDDSSSIWKDAAPRPAIRA
jgi:hypothetical protein